MLRKILEAQDRNGGLGAMLKTILEAAEFPALFWWSYLPIIVECCWTAASRSLSSIVHSPISEHPEKTRAQRHSGQIPPKKKKSAALVPVPLLSDFGRFQCPKTSRVWQKRHPPRDAAAAAAAAAAASALRASARRVCSLVCRARTVSASPAACAERSPGGATLFLVMGV